MLKVVDVGRGEATTEVVWGNSIVHITYDPNRHTPQTEQVWAEYERSLGGFSSKVICLFAHDVITKWDLMGDAVFTEDDQGGRVFGTGVLIEADHPFPLDDVDKLAVLPTPLLGAITGKIQQEMIANTEGKVKSPASSGS